MNAIKDLIDALNNDSVVALLHVVHDAIDGTANLRAGVISQYNFFPGPVAGETRKARRNVRGIVVTWDSRTRARACWKVWTHLDGWSHSGR